MRVLGKLKSLLRRSDKTIKKSDEAIQKEIAVLNKKIDSLAAEVGNLTRTHKHEMKWRGIIKRDLNAVLRHQYFPDLALMDSFSLNAKRFRLHSQNEEDGIILTLLRMAGALDRRFVEIGCGRSGGNAATLAYEFGWSGLMVDESHDALEHTRRTFSVNPGVAIVRAQVTSDNINTLLRTHGFTGDVDFFSIDIDSYDYWLFHALEACSPRLLVMEYNALFGPDRAVTISNGPVSQTVPKGYIGASTATMMAMAAYKGVGLGVCVEVRS